jgi:peptidyl-prolyl cis-trans isomerase B (cyclophilin B)
VPAPSTDGAGGRSSRTNTIALVAVLAGLVVAGIVAVKVLGDDDTPSVVADTVSITLPVEVDGDSLGEFAYGTGACAPDPPGTPDRGPFADAPQRCIGDGPLTATMVTSAGTIVIDLDVDAVPGTVNNFVTLARYGTYDETTLFRIDPSIAIIQGGAFGNTDSPGYTIPDEANGFTYDDGDLAMARTQAPDSGGQQWFFVTGPNGHLLDDQGTYVVFGHVVDGLDVLHEIMDVPLQADGQTPVTPIQLISVRITEG